MMVSAFLIVYMQTKFIKNNPQNIGNGNIITDLVKLLIVAFIPPERQMKGVTVIDAEDQCCHEGVVLQGWWPKRLRGYSHLRV